MRRPLRVLFTSTPGAGHVSALAPVAEALRDRGHHVQWAVAPDGGAAVEKMGFEWSPAGLPTAVRRAVSAEVVDAIMRLPMCERRGPMFAAFFARAAGPVMQRDLAPIIDRLRPDVMVREVCELAAAPMAAARGIPLVTVAFSGVLTERARDEVFDDLRPLWTSEGLGEPSWVDFYGQLYLHPFPASFGQRPDSQVVRPIRRGRGMPSPEPAPWVAPLGSARPLIYVSAGTEVSAISFPWHELFTAIGSMDVDAVATIGQHIDQADFGAVPTNIRVERFVPQADLLGRASAVVSHGGAGTVLGAAAHGLTQVIVPLFADQWENGVAVTDAGCGIVLEPGRRSPEDFDKALHELLDGSSHRDAANRVAHEIDEMPTAAEVAVEIEALAHT